ncbi:hypothetical protein BJ322DRAFT_1109280 [Thelephora terrestris]|uniref:Nephrocystin 3-like N-terminal domain-containing protein n=1 Tax=Thelephora terrestris TaxID=56493 RepID=A0A9P6HFZ0_9AGAM|nr:hypothetical protein BJ322DRAFT_1109280 [Thelephora terrestris]
MAGETGIEARSRTNAGYASQSRAVTKSRFIDGTKMLLYVAKESADALGPLKSCLGGISAIVDLCDKSNDVEGSFTDLIEWVVTLKEELLKDAPSDGKEAERRTKLKRSAVDPAVFSVDLIAHRSLENVEKRSRSLLGKKWPARFLDTPRDSAIVVGFVEEIRQAILLYRVSQQQSTLDQIAGLTSSFDALAITNEFPDVKKKATSVLGRLHRLHQLVSKTGSGDAKIDDKESRRRATLIDSLMMVEAALGPLLDRFTSGNNAVTTDDRQMVEDFAEDVRVAVQVYEVNNNLSLSQRMDTYEQNLTLISSADQSLLNQFRRAEGAEYDHRNRGGCLKGTRMALLDDSTIAKTVAERCDAVGVLGASFFFPGDPKDDHGLIFPTLAFQLAHKYAAFRFAFLPHLRLNPDLGHKSLNKQVEKLIIGPLQSVKDTMVIVIDGLDECKSPPEVLSELERIVNRVPTVKFFITSRPEPRIKHHFARQGCTAESRVVYNAAQDTIDGDIRVFLKHKLSRLAADRSMDNWPTAAQLDLLGDRAALLFAYAVATVKYLENSRLKPSKKYAIIAESRDDTKHEGEVKDIHKGLSLDSLCISILKVSFADIDARDTAAVRLVLAAALSTHSPSPSAILDTVNARPGGELMDIEEVTQILESFHSVLDLPEDPVHPIRPFHRLLSHCLTDPQRCSDRRFLVENHVGTDR